MTIKYDKYVYTKIIGYLILRHEHGRKERIGQVTAVDFLDSLLRFERRKNSTITATINLQWSKGIQIALTNLRKSVCFFAFALIP